MTSKPTAPDWMPAATSAAFTRIVDRLWSRGDWRPEYIALAEVAAGSCSMYARLVHDKLARGVFSAGDIEECRLDARKSLASMQWFDEDRAHLALVDAEGHDSDLIAICRPLEN